MPLHDANRRLHDAEKRGELVDEIVNLLHRMDARYARLFRRLFLAGVILTVFLLVMVGVVWTTTSKVSDLADSNTHVIRELARVADEAQKRGARTDRKQCADIERLKSLARRSTRRGIKSIQNSDLSAADKAEFIAGARESLRAFAPQRIVANGEELAGVASCSALPNSKIAKP